MMNQKIILVIGATGAQGGSVARHLLAGGDFAVRCLTRKPFSNELIALKRSGAEVVKGDLNDLESLRAALRGCYGVFGVTNHWEHFTREYGQGKNLVDAVAASDVQHFVFSTLPSAKIITHGEIEVPHFDIKAQLEQYARSLGLGATFVHVALCFEDFLTYLRPQMQRDGTYALGFPQGDTPLAGVAIEDIGGVVAAIFSKPAEFRYETVGIVGDDLPPNMYAEIMTRILGKAVSFNYTPREVFAASGFRRSLYLANMFEFNRLYIPNRRTDLEQSHALYPEIQSFEVWLSRNRSKFSEIS